MTPVLVSAFAIAACSSGSTQTGAPTNVPSTAASAGVSAATSTARASAGVSALPGPYPTAAPGSLAGKKVGVAAYDPSIPFYTTFFPSFVKQAAIGGETITFANSKGDSLLSRQQAEQFIAQEFDGLILDYEFPEGWKEIVAEANAKGMCVLNVSGANMTGAINFISQAAAGGRAVGEDAGKFINESLGGKAEVGMIVQPDNPGTHKRDLGFEEAIKRVAPGATIVAQAPGLSTPDALAAVANMLQAHPDIAVMWANNDDQAVPIETAFKEAGKTDPSKFYIAGTNGSPVVREALAKGDSLVKSTYSWLAPTRGRVAMRELEKCMAGLPYAQTNVAVGALLTNATVADFETVLNDPFGAAADAAIAKGYKQYDTKMTVEDGANLPGESPVP